MEQFEAQIDPSAAGAAPSGAPADAAARSDAAFSAQLQAGIELARRVIGKFRTLTEEDGEDLAQEIGILYLARHASISHPMAWFYECARRAALHRLQRRAQQGKQVELPAQLAAPAPDENGLSVKRLFFALSEHCRSVLGCLIVEGQTLQETAAVSGHSVNQLFTMKQKCLKLLRARWLHQRAPADGAAE